MRKSRALAIPIALAMASCGLEPGEDEVISVSDAEFDPSGEQFEPVSSDVVVARAPITQPEEVDLSQSTNEEVVNTLVIDVNDQGFSLTGGDGIFWTVDMEERVEVEGSVAAEKYLKVGGQLNLPNEVSNTVVSLGCLDIELKDNVLYREQTRLRLATTGISGQDYAEVIAPLRVSIDKEASQGVPILDDSMTLAQFEENSIKSHTTRLCFEVDYSNVPAQLYSGQIVLQYLKPGLEEPQPCVENCPCDEQNVYVAYGRNVETGDERLGVVSSFVSDTSAKENYNYHSWSAHPIVGPRPEPYRLKVFLHEGSDGTAINFVANIDSNDKSIGSKYNKLLMDVRVDDNDVEDRILLSDDGKELRKIGEGADTTGSLYRGRFRYWYNTDGGVIGPLAGEQTKIKVDLPDTGDIRAVEVVSGDGKIYSIPQSGKGYQSFILQKENVCVNQTSDPR